MANVSQIDVNEPIVDKEGKVTDYFEALFYDLLERTGGEGDDLIEDIISAAQSVLASKNTASISRVKSDIVDIQSLNAKLSAANQKINTLTKQVNDLTKALNMPNGSKFAKLNERIEQLEKQIGR